MTLLPRSCKTCASHFEDGPQMFCRAAPPQVNIIMLPVQDALGRQGMAPQSFTMWPQVQPDQWCMHWARDLALQLS